MRREVRRPAAPSWPSRSRRASPRPPVRPPTRSTPRGAASSLFQRPVDGDRNGTVLPDIDAFEVQ